MKQVSILLLIFLSCLAPKIHAEPLDSGTELYLSLNIEEGKYLELSDGSTFEIEPDDQLFSSLWITPFPVILGRSDDPDYPVTITNLNTGTSVKGKPVPLKELLKREKEKEKALPPPKTTERPPKPSQPAPKKEAQTPKKETTPKQTPPKTQQTPPKQSPPKTQETQKNT